MNQLSLQLFSNQQVPGFMVFTQVIGGLGLFLYGMHLLSDGLKKRSGERMRRLLSALTQNRVVAVGVGAFVTMIVQSSSATTVMLVSLVQAGLMQYKQTLGIILGADIGTTITVQLIAFKLSDFSLLMIGVGFGMMILSKRQALQQFGEALMGFGMLFFGMHIMSQAMYPFRSYPPFLNLLITLENPLFGILFGTLITSLIQSSAAFIGILIALSTQGLLTLEAAIPLLFGANIGTCITAFLASLNTRKEARKVAYTHILFKVFGVLLFVGWIPQFAEFVRWISPDGGVST
ncbi:MAG: Na/Pi cotransporter family protein, partial [Methanobacteriota archaeon]